MAVTKQQLAQWSREFSAKNPDKVSGAGSTAQNITTKKNSVTKEQLSQWSREFDKKEAQRQAEQEQNTRDKALQQYTERHISDMGEVDARNDTSLAGRVLARQDLSVADATAPLKRGNGDDRRQWRIEGGAVGAAASRMQATAKQTLGAATRPVARRRRDGEVYFFPGNTFCGGMYEPLRRISKWQWLPVERPVLPR